jgi:uncharacterized protein
VILESIVTSVDRQGLVNIAPMGPRVDSIDSRDDPQPLTFLLRPFDSSHTYRNLIATRKGVIHVTDDAELFAKAAVDALRPEQSAELVERWGDSDWWPLRDCHRWFAVAVESVSDDRPRVEMVCRVVESKTVRPFFGFNRAKHAVIEAAILATRTHLLQPQEILEEIERLQPLIDKTGGPAEHSAFDFLRETIDDRLASQ